MRFEVRENSPGHWAWSLYLGDAIPIARSEAGYPSPIQARAAAAEFARAVALASEELRRR
ncbi:hypothetical protein [Methylobacterium organophilum]|uniref:DUF1508 domain-containing protein n=1 Tax=Methylobacterium organophilum TaxID=410 RepID=A0ABQ4T6G6_METOR|nr:hypothetical protein [Methylobacterium organophilum]UMY17733.1 hypothetical protein MMB17_24555 [Methylobacterium organophilum]GJE26034.1 hypothetical protein LKMONMHP_0878 [Methylobacterium organophilum]